jgi:hypothetical protein
MIIFAGFSVFLFLVTVLIAQLETYVPTRRVRTLPQDAEEQSHRHRRDQDEPSAA